MELEINDKRCVPPIDEAPWLVYTHGYSKYKKIQTFCTISSNYETESYIKSIPELRGKYIHTCRYGWLLLKDEEEDIVSLWNPVTLRAIPLPPLSACDEEIWFSSCTLTCPPESDNPNRDNCLVLLLGDGVIFSCRPGRPICNSRWATQRIEVEGRQVDIKDAIALNGVIYCFADTSAADGVGRIRSLASMEVSSDHDSNSLTLSSLRVDLPPCFHIRPLYYLVESCGLIYSICVSRDEDCRIVEVGVWELDLQGTNWVEVKCLDGRAFFLARNNCSSWGWGGTISSSKSQSGGGEENCVYFVMPDEVRSLYSYRLHDRSLTILLPCRNLKTPFSSPIWVMPQHRRLPIEKRFEKLDMLDQRISIAKYEEIPPLNETQKNLLCELPLHIIELVSKCLHLFDYWNFRASCKIFHSLAPAAKWRTNNFLPLFMFFKNDDGLCVMDPCRDDPRSFILPLSRDFFSIKFSKDGWLLVLVGQKSLQFCNPFLRLRGEFPPCEGIADFTSAGFSTYPTSPDCLTIGLITRFDRVIIYCFQYGEDTWQDYEFPQVEFEFSLGTTSPIYHGGAFYFLHRFGYLGVFELVGGEASWRVYDKPHGLDGLLRSYHLVECDGELLSVFVRYNSKGWWIKVFRFNHLEMNWVKVRSLENHILFVSPSSSFSEVIREGGTGNKIYFGRLRGKGIIYYSLETRKYHVFGHDGSMEDFYGTTEPLRCCWV